MEDEEYELEFELALAELDNVEPDPETFYQALNTALQRLKAYSGDVQAQA
ncbi:MAG: hypothetical protein O7C67_08860 [Gammaproteobacteria bacterium]|nr:hypothetical protein [Gammaproteobacteria bacterium]